MMSLKAMRRPPKIPTLPYHLLVEHILSRLPAESLIRFKSVCKTWLSTISSPGFAKLHGNVCSTKHNYFLIHDLIDKLLFLLPYDEHSNIKSFVKLKNVFTEIHGKVKIVGCCNGLVCLFIGEKGYGYFALWNPITQETNEIANCLARAQALCWSFGYASSIDDYKIVSWFDTKRPRSSPRSYVFSLKRGEWRRVDKMKLRKPGEGGERIWLTRNPLYVDGDVYFQRGDVLSGRMECAVRFDLGTEQVTEIPCPDDGRGTLFATNKCLMLDCPFSGDKYMLKKPAGDMYTWEKHLISYRKGLWGISETGKGLVPYKGCFKLTDLRGKVGMPSEYDHENVDVCNYTESLISPFGTTLC